MMAPTIRLGIRIAICSAALALCAGGASAEQVRCSRDLNNDGKADRKDHMLLERAMGGILGAAPYDERVDFNGDRRIDEEDREAYRHCTPVTPASPGRSGK